MVKTTFPPSHRLSPTSIPLRHLSSPSPSILSSDFDRLLSEDEDRESNASIEDADPPIDRGRGAWRCLAGCWLLEAVMFGILNVVGIFQSYYTKHPAFQQHSSAIPNIGTLAMGVAWLGMPFVNVLALRWPRHQRLLCASGWLICICGLVAASFAWYVWQLLLFQGVVYGVGCVVVGTAYLFILNTWFVERRGLAYGILFGGGGISGLVIPLVIETLLRRYGYAVALRSCAFALLVVGSLGLYLLRPRPTTYSRPRHTSDGAEDKTRPVFPPGVGTIVRGTHFWIFTAMMLTQSLGSFVPFLFLPAYADTLGLPPSAGAALLALISISLVGGQLLLGYVSDKVNPYVPASAYALISGLAVFLLWGDATATTAGSMTKLSLFAVVWGCCATSYSVLLPRMCTFLTDDPELVMTFYGIFAFQRGVANIVAGPICAFLLRETVDMEAFALGKYRDVVVFTGGCMVLSSLGVAGLFCKAQKGAV